MQSEDLWPSWVLTKNGMESLKGFSKSSNSTTHQAQRDLIMQAQPPIGSHHAYIQTSCPNNGVDRNAIAIYTAHESMTITPEGIRYRRISLRFQLVTMKE